MVKFALLGLNRLSYCKLFHKLEWNGCVIGYLQLLSRLKFKGITKYGKMDVLACFSPLDEDSIMFRMYGKPVCLYSP